MIEIGIPAGADESEKRQITDLCGELTAFDDRLESLAESADEASADLSGDRRGGLRLLIVWVAVAVIGTISLGFVTGDPDLFPRLPLSMFVGLSLGFLVALPAFRRDKDRMDRIAQSAADVADQADKSRRKLTSIIFADHHFAPDDAQWVADHRERARGYERDLAASIRTEVADRAWASRARVSPILLVALFGATVATGIVAAPEGVPSWWVSVLSVVIIILGLGFIVISETSASVRSQARQNFITKNISANEKRWLDRIRAGVNRSSFRIAGSDDG